MSGFIDRRSRIMDVMITDEGRRQLANGDLRIVGASFTDGGTFYAGSQAQGALSTELRVMLECATLSEDQITYEADDSGRLMPFKGSPNEQFAAGQLISYSFTAGITSAFSGANETSSPITGDAFASVVAGLLTGSIDSINKHRLIGNDDGVFDTGDFDVQPGDLSFMITNDSPIPSEFHVANVSKMDSLFADPRLSNLENFAFLPPVNKVQHDRTTSGAGVHQRSIGNYSPWGAVSPPNWSTLSAELKASERLGLSRQIRFDPTTRTNKLHCQVFETRSDSVRKLDVIDYGRLKTDEPGHPEAHVFFLGRVMEDALGSQTFVHLFTMVFD